GLGAKRRCLRLVGESLHVHRGKCRIADQPVTLGKRLVGGFRDEVMTLGAVEGEPRKIASLQKVEHEQGRQALAVGRNLPDVETTRGYRYRFARLAAMGSETLWRVVAALFLQEGGHIARDRAAIEIVRAAPGYAAQRCAKRRQAPDLAGG